MRVAIAKVSTSFEWLTLADLLQSVSADVILLTFLPGEVS